MKKFEKTKKFIEMEHEKIVKVGCFLEKFNKNYILRKYKYIILKLR